MLRMFWLTFQRRSVNDSNFLDLLSMEESYGRSLFSLILSQESLCKLLFLNSGVAVDDICCLPQNPYHVLDAIMPSPAIQVNTTSQRTGK